MEEPHRSVVRSQLQSVLTSKGARIPPINRALKLPALAFPDWDRHIQRILAHVRAMFRAQLLPFHLPSVKVLEARHLPVSSCVHNWRVWLEKYPFDVAVDDIPCCCHEYNGARTVNFTTSGHVATPLATLPELLRVPNLQNFLQHSAKSAS